MKPYLYNTTVRTAKVHASTTVKQKQAVVLTNQDVDTNCAQLFLLTVYMIAQQSKTVQEHANQIHLEV